MRSTTVTVPDSDSNAASTAGERALTSTSATSASPSNFMRAARSASCAIAPRKRTRRARHARSTSSASAASALDDDDIAADVIHARDADRAVGHAAERGAPGDTVSRHGAAAAATSERLRPSSPGSASSHFGRCGNRGDPAGAPDWLHEQRCLNGATSACCEHPEAEAGVLPPGLDPVHTRRSNSCCANTRPTGSHPLARRRPESGQFRAVEQALIALPRIPYPRHNSSWRRLGPWVFWPPEREQSLEAICRLAAG